MNTQTLISILKKVNWVEAAEILQMQGFDREDHPDNFHQFRNKDGLYIEVEYYSIIYTIEITNGNLHEILYYTPNDQDEYVYNS